jgi:two-component system, NtrC family, response regulator AtoC
MGVERILLVDAERLVRETLQEQIARKGFDVECVGDGRAAIEALTRQSYDLVLSSAKLPGASGLEVVAAARDIPVILTGSSCVESAVEAMRAGAFYYMSGPVDHDALFNVISRVEKLKVHAGPPPVVQNEIIAASPAMQELVAQVEKVAASGASVFITGETGTGKEVLAKLIHDHSKRAGRTFVGVNCAAIPDTLVDSEFFGHEKGSFTGAHAQRIGRFEAANGGTLLLDEVTEIPINLQPKLLRVLQERQFERVGGTSPIHVDLRIVATSNRNLAEAVAEGIFREDLLYRLCVVQIEIPPLRERPEDIIPLAEHYIPTLCAANHLEPKELSPEMRKKLLSHDWPGNVRELLNVLERSIVLSDNKQLEWV